MAWPRWIAFGLALLGSVVGHLGLAALDLPDPNEVQLEIAEGGAVAARGGGLVGDAGGGVDEVLIGEATAGLTGILGDVTVLGAAEDRPLLLDGSPTTASVIASIEAVGPASTRVSGAGMSGSIAPIGTGPSLGQTACTLRRAGRCGRSRWGGRVLRSRR